MVELNDVIYGTGWNITALTKSSPLLDYLLEILILDFVYLQTI